MADTNEKMNYSVKYTFDTETENKTLTKSFSDYNTSVTDDQLRTVGKTLAAQELFAGDAGVISSLVKIERVETKTTMVPVNATA